MIPYMIRRAQELNQMKYPLDIQFTLLLDEVKARINSWLSSKLFIKMF